jgi:hypothetical protein
MKTRVRKDKQPHNDENQEDKGVKVFIIHPVNKIKKKIGCLKNDDFSFSNKQITDASLKNNPSDEQKNQQIQDIISNLTLLWENIKKSDDIQKEKHKTTMLRIYINRLHDLSLQFSLALTQDFTKSLKIFIEDAILVKKNHQIIIQAHIDVINLSLFNKITHADSSNAESLKKILKEAIEKNS